MKKGNKGEYVAQDGNKKTQKYKITKLQKCNPK